MNHGEDQGRNSLASLNATRRVVFLPPLEEMPKKEQTQPETYLAWIFAVIFAVITYLVVVSMNTPKT